MPVIPALRRTQTGRTLRFAACQPSWGKTPAKICELQPQKRPHLKETGIEWYRRTPDTLRWPLCVLYTHVHITYTHACTRTHTHNYSLLQHLFHMKSFIACWEPTNVRLPKGPDRRTRPVLCPHSGQTRQGGDWAWGLGLEEDEFPIPANLAFSFEGLWLSVLRPCVWGILWIFF